MTGSDTDLQFPRIRHANKDNLPRELQFLQPLNAADPQYARIMVSPRKYVASQDGSPQTLAISAVIASVFNANTLAVGTWSLPPAGVGVLFEAIRANIICNDASGQIQVNAPLIIGLAGGINLVTVPPACPAPFVFPKLSGVSWQMQARQPMLCYLPSDGAFPNGPAAQIGLTNLDSTATHTYSRTLYYIYRYIYDIDWSKERVYVAGTMV